MNLPTDTLSPSIMSEGMFLCNKIQSYHEKLTAEDRQYLYQRGLSDDTINRNKIGRTPEGRLMIPYWKNGYVCYYATRYLPGGKYPEQKYKKMSYFA